MTQTEAIRTATRIAKIRRENIYVMPSRRNGTWIHTVWNADDIERFYGDFKPLCFVDLNGMIH